jgi:hypothetical protein
MKAGKYWVGDLCYVLKDRWSEVCELIIVNSKCLDGIFTLKDGTEFAIFSTAYGDGEYPDQFGHHYGVDSGSIGCVLHSKIHHSLHAEAERLGHTFEIKEDFEVGEEDGIIQIGDIQIDTLDENVFDEDWDEEED